MNAERPFVIDANVAVKWFVEEEYSAQARTFRPLPNLIAPRFVMIEVGNVFLNKVRIGELGKADANQAFDSMRLRLDLREEAGLQQAAFSIALTYGASFYDAVYVALALQEQCQLVSADVKLRNALGRDFADTMLWLGDVPLV